MTYILVHNPGCGTSKKGLELLQANGIEPEIRKYTNKSAQLSEAELREIAKKMGDVSPKAFWRAKEMEKAGLSEESTDDVVFAAMAENPKLIQRPIGINGEKAVLGRPNERLLEIL